MVRVRLIVAWLLLAALPIKGFAAASMLLCTPSAHAAMQAAAVSPAVAVDMHSHHARSQSAHGHAAQSHGSHGQTAHDHAAHGHAAHGQPAPTSAPTADLGNSSPACSLCAACCHAVALVSLPATAAAAAPPSFTAAEPPLRVRSLPARVPDKPPRA